MSSSLVDAVRKTEHRRSMPRRSIGEGGRLVRVWKDWDAAPDERRVPGTASIAFIALLLGSAAGVWSVTSGHALDYGDASSHLTIARRLWDATSPGFSQLGTVWLPIPHILLTPFTLSLWAWHTGASGAVLGTLCLVVSASALYRVAARLGFGRAGRLGSVAVFLVNPSVLYIHTTALTEPVLIAGIAASLAGVSRWATSTRRLSAGELAVFAGVPAGVAVLSRYEGWAYFLAAAFLVLIVSARRWGVRASLGPFVGFCAVPSAGILWWLTYNWVLYGDPFEFSRGEYSASALQATTVAEGMAPTKGSLGLSVASYNWPLLYTAGPAVLALAAVAIVLGALLHGLDTRNLVIGVAASTYVFSIVSLYLGKTVLWVLNTLPSDLWNTRFAMSPMIAVSLLIGGLVDDARSLPVRPFLQMKTYFVVLAPIILVVVLVGQTVWWAHAPISRSTVLGEAHSQANASAEARNGFLWLREHYEGGSVLIDENSTGSAMMPTLGIPLKDCIMRSSGTEFELAVATPQRYAQWVVVQRDAFENGSESATSAQSDAVGISLRDDPSFLLNYRLAYSNGVDLFFERVN